MRVATIFRAPTIFAAFCVTIAFGSTQAVSSAAEVQRSAPIVEFDVTPYNDKGLLDLGKAFEFSVLLKGFKPQREGDLVAVFESLAYPHRLVSLTPDETSADLTASTRFEPRSTVAGADGQPLRMEVVVARLKGLRVETLFSRAVYLTTSPASPTRPGADPSLPVPARSPMDALLEEASTTDRHGRPVEPLLLPEDIREEYFGEAPPTVQGPVYWKQIGETVTRRWKQELTHLRKGRAGQGLRVQFKLYPQGFAQLIQIERSSGDPSVDEAALRTVLSLHPFPPFPPDVGEPFVDVHVDLAGSKR